MAVGYICIVSEKRLADKYFFGRAAIFAADDAGVAEGRGHSYWSGLWRLALGPAE
jgi:hypothetical protein